MGYWDQYPVPWIVGRDGLAPENTFYAFDGPACARIPIEMDVWSTSDGVPVVLHDKMTTRTTGVALDVTQTTLAELRLLNAAANWDASLFPPVPIPTLEECIERYGSTVPMIIEVKGDVPTAQKVAQLVKKYAISASVVVASFGAPQLQAVKNTNPPVRTMLMVAGEAGLPGAEQVGALGVWGISVKSTLLSQPYVERLHSAGLRVFGWALDHVFAAEQLFALGTDGVYTNAPTYLALLVNASSPPGETWPGTRLMPGWRFYASSSPNDPRPLFQGGLATFDWTAPPGIGDVFLVYPGIRTPEAEYSLEATLTARMTSGDPSSAIGLRLGFASDHDTSDLGRPPSEGLPSNGYLIEYRASGSVLIRHVIENVPTDLATASWPAPGLGETISLLVHVTPTSISATRTDTGHVVEAIDAPGSRRGFVSAYGRAEVPALGRSVLTY